MTLEEAQLKVDEWIEEYGVRYFDIMTNTALLMEEVGELSSILARQYGEQSFKEEKESESVQDEIQDEMADVIFVLLCLSNQMGINLTQAIERNLAKKTDRDKNRHKRNKKL